VYEVSIPSNSEVGKPATPVSCLSVKFRQAQQIVENRDSRVRDRIIFVRHENLRSEKRRPSEIEIG
jgi:hypothetical protein